MNAPDTRQQAEPARPELLRAPEHVLATLERDGTRRWIRPRPSAGRFLTARRAVAYALMAVFLAAPLVHVGGKPLILLDVVRRQFTLFGTTFVPTDTPLLLLLVLSALLGIFLLTALFGRVWCGWACPQTVYMEFLYRPIERLFEGSHAEQRKRDREGPDVRRALKNVTFLLVSFLLANNFLAYFVGWEQLWVWMRGSPLNHPTAFAVMGVVTAAMLFDFGWFREQTCLVACPYGRLQSVLLDRQSLIVGYDARRGEPRGKKKRALPVAEASALGDCVDCSACVITCPTGIDIRDGLQMECIGCAQCIDACDAIMDRVGRPRGLIRYSSQAELDAQPRRVLRGRVVVYSALLVGMLVALGVGLTRRGESKLTVLRGIDAPYEVLPTGEVSNQIRVKVQNMSGTARTYTIEAPALAPTWLVAPESPLTVEAQSARTTTAFVKLPRAMFEDGRTEVTLRVTSDGFSEERAVTVLGPRDVKPQEGAR